MFSQAAILFLTPKNLNINPLALKDKSTVNKSSLDEKTLVEPFWIKNAFL